MLKKYIYGPVGLALFGLVFISFTQTAQAVPISGLFNTGVDINGDALTPFLANGDAHFTLEGPDFVLAPANVINRNAAWVAGSPTYQWIGRADGPAGNTPSAFYTFTTTFDLTGLDPTSAIITGGIAVDDAIRISVNGVDSGVALGGFASIQAFTLDSDFISGLNTLQFIVENGPVTSTNPMGLLIANIEGTADLSSSSTNVPEPAAIALFGFGLVGLGFAKRRKLRDARRID